MDEYKASLNAGIAIVILKFIKQYFEECYPDKSGAKKYIEALQMGIDALTTDVAQVDVVSEQIIRKKAEVSDYWLKYVKSYRATQGYSEIEHDVDNFLRGYNEAVEDMLAILDGKQQKDATMISDREKLINLMSSAGWNLFTDDQSKEQLADFLIANGVMVKMDSKT